MGDCYCRVLGSWGTVHRGLFTGDGVMEDCLHRRLCSQRTVSLGTVYGEHIQHVESLLENMPKAPLLQHISISSVFHNVYSAEPQREGGCTKG